MQERAKRYEPKPSVDTHFAWLRTRWSLERTAMSWMRTAIALIGFGFTIYQVLRNLNASASNARYADAPQQLGLALIAAGVMSLTLALLSYHGVLGYMWSEEFRNVAGTGEFGRRSFVPIAMILLIFIGIWAFIAVLLRA